MKMAIALLALISLNTFAACEDQSISFQVNISEQTFDNSYDNDQVAFSETDNIQVINKTNKREIIFTDALIENDGAGNFFVVGKNEAGESIEIYHDHETWHYGLTSSFISLREDEFNLSQIKDCDFEKLFNL